MISPHCPCASCDRAAQGEEAITAALEGLEIWRERALLAEARARALEATVGALLESVA